MPDPMAAEFERMQGHMLSRRGQPAIYTPQAGAPRIVTGIWDASDRVRGAGEDRFSGRLWLQLSSLDFTPIKNDIVAIDGVTYRVSNHPPDDYDGAGGVYLYLRRRA